MRQALWLVLGVIASVLYLSGTVAVFYFAYAVIKAHQASEGPVVVHRSDGTTPTPSPWESEPEHSTPAPSPPEIKRAIPVFHPQILAGCTPTDLDTIRTSIRDAIGIGSPLYNSGDIAGSYRAYDSAAQDIASSIEDTCKGPAKVLRETRVRASKRSTLPEQVWTVRDTFDGLLEVIERRGTAI